MGKGVVLSYILLRAYCRESGSIKRGLRRFQNAVFEKFAYEKLEAFLYLFLDWILF